MMEGYPRPHPAAPTAFRHHVFQLWRTSIPPDTTKFCEGRISISTAPASQQSWLRGHCGQQPACVAVC